MENDAKLATENQKIPERFIGLTGAFQQRLSIMWTKIFMRRNNPLVRVSLTLQKRKAINNKASRRQRWIPNAIAGWALLLNNRICVFRDLSHGSCLFFFFFLHPTVNNISDKNEKCITQNYFFVCIFWIVPYLVRMKVLSPFFSQKYISVRFLHYQSIGTTRRKKKNRM